LLYVAYHFHIYLKKNIDEKCIISKIPRGFNYQMMKDDCEIDVYAKQG
jgi:hypothetical protein